MNSDIIFMSESKGYGFVKTLTSLSFLGYPVMVMHSAQYVKLVLKALNTVHVYCRTS